MDECKPLLVAMLFRLWMLDLLPIVVVLLVPLFMPMLILLPILLLQLLMVRRCKSRERRFRVYEEAPGFRPGPRGGASRTVETRVKSAWRNNESV